MKNNICKFLILLLTGHTTEIIRDKEISREIKFALYTQENPEEPIFLTVNDKLKEDIKRHIPWKFLIHGWTTSPSVSPWFSIHKTNYFKKGPHNIVFVDWSKPANQSYIESVINTRGSGKYLGEFILNLKKNNVPLNQIHLLGHSLGSHMAGFAGKYVFEVANEKIDRITGTDPARPLFETPWLLNKKSRISDTDAEFVDIVHTDGGNYAMITPVGQIDYYPNGGKRFQPGCEDDPDENCSHARSVGFFGESILSDQFIASQCPNYEEFLNKNCQNHTNAIFGEKVDKNLKGVFYFTTNSETPYAQGSR